MVKKRENVTISITQIIILIVSIIAFSYFVGAEFKVVSAQTNTSSQIDYAKVPSSLPRPRLSPSDLKPLVLSEIPPFRPNPEYNKRVEKALKDLEKLDAKEAKLAFLKNNEGKLVTGILGNAAIAASIYAGSRFILGQLGASPEFTKSFSAAASIGYFAGSSAKTIAAFFGKSLGIGAPLIGLGVAILIFAITFKQTKYRQVTFTCYPWDAPTGGRDCEKCNNAESGVPCTEYQCRSLGQQCELANKGTTEELCVYVNRLDPNPPVIQPWLDVLTNGYKYAPDNTISPPHRGVKIVPQGNNTGCVAPWTPLKFGVTLNQPARCKYSTEPKENFEAMENNFLSSGLKKYNHSFQMSLPSNESLAAGNATLINGGRFTLYVRCENAAGRSNTANFVFRFCVDQGPDTTAPLIVSTSILNNMPIAFNQSSVALQVYVNEPSECKWSKVDQNYDDMENQMTCNTGVFEMNAQGLYQCSTTLTGLLDRVDNDFYFRCKDQPHLKNTANESKRNVDSTSCIFAEDKNKCKFTLKGTEPLVINSVKPNGTAIKDSTDVIKVKLEVKTSAGYNEGRALCSYEGSGTGGNFNDFFNTDSFEHSQDLFLTAGTYNYNIRCIDLGGNIDSTISSFTVETDTQAPSVVRVFRQENRLKVITNEEESQCVYGNFGCDYLFKDGTNMSRATNGTEHSTAWDANKVFYIKCSDKFGNQPFPNQCNIVAKPFEIK